MRFNVINYLIGEGVRNLFKNKKSTMSSLMIMCATMLVFGLFFVIGENINAFVENVAEAQEIRVNLKINATESEIEEVGNEILAIDGVRNAEFVSKDEALDYMKDMLGDEVLDGYSERNIFSTAYNVTLTDLKLSSQVQDEIKKIDNIDSIQSRDETINGLVAIANGVRIVSAVILTLLVLISIFIIGNTIKLTVHARRKEISIMKYVGATDSFIRWPFVIEGIIIGIVAALLSILVLGIAYSLITNAAANSIISTMGIKLLSFTDMTTLLVIVYMVLGIGIGALGSSISMRKYLQV